MKAKDGRIECPLCSGTGTERARGRSNRSLKQLCALCGDRGSVTRTDIGHLLRARVDADDLRHVVLRTMREQVVWIADLMQRGDAETAARLARFTFRLASALTARTDRMKPRADASS